MIDNKLADRRWMAGEQFSLADCAAAPALFYAMTQVPLMPAQQRLAAYAARVMQRPSVIRVLDEARPFFQYYPFHDALPPEFQTPAAG